MGNRIKRLAHFIIIIATAVVIVAASATPSSARHPRPVYMGPSGEILGADPGEDPHMKLEDPGTVPFQDDGCTVPLSGTGASSHLSGHGGSSRLATESRVKTKLIVLLRLAFGMFLR